MLQNYDRFVAGINEVHQVEQDLVAAHKTAKVTASLIIAPNTLQHGRADHAACGVTGHNRQYHVLVLSSASLCMRLAACLIGSMRTLYLTLHTLNQCD